jgi:hypothetical protein
MPVLPTLLPTFIPSLSPTLEPSKEKLDIWGLLILVAPVAFTFIILCIYKNSLRDNCSICLQRFKDYFKASEQKPSPQDLQSVATDKPYVQIRASTEQPEPVVFGYGSTGNDIRLSTIDLKTSGPAVKSHRQNPL